MYTIQVNSEWRCEFPDSGDGWPVHYYIVRDSEGNIVFENDWQYGFADESSARSVMEAYFPGIDFVIEGDV